VAVNLYDPAAPANEHCRAWAAGAMLTTNVAKAMGGGVLTTNVAKAMGGGGPNYWFAGIRPSRK
jgi:hypothetical protein